MIALWLLSAHLIGDFILQSRFHAALKFKDRWIRTGHVVWYLVPFVPVVCAYGYVSDLRTWQALGFLAAVGVAHWVTDSRRFHSTLGDVIQWRIDLRLDPVACKKAWLERITERAESGTLRAVDVDDKLVRWPPPNEWEPLPLIIDQTLHVVQITVLAAVFLA